MRLFCILSTSKNIFVYYCMNLVFGHNSLLPKCFPFFQIIQCRHRSQLQPRLSDILCRLEADEILQELHILLHFPQDLLVLTWKLHFLPLSFLFGLLPFPLFCLFQLLYFMNDFLNHLNQSWLVLVNLYICAPPQFTQDIYTWNLRTRYKIHLVVVSHPALPDGVEDDVSALHDARLYLRILPQPPALLKLHQRLAQRQVTSHPPPPRLSVPPSRTGPCCTEPRPWLSWPWCCVELSPAPSLHLCKEYIFNFTNSIARYCYC